MEKPYFWAKYVISGGGGFDGIYCPATAPPITDRLQKTIPQRVRQADDIKFYAMKWIFSFMAIRMLL